MYHTSPLLSWNQEKHISSQRFIVFQSHNPRQIMAQPFGVLFDMDGVLVHSNPVHKKAIQQFCDKYRKHASEHFLRKHIYGRTNKEWIPVLFDGITPEQTVALSEEKEALFRNIFHPREAALPGLHPFLDMLKFNDIPLAVATSAPRQNADFILSELDIADYFQVVLSSSDVETGKPHPDIYLKSADSIGMEPQSCIVIEDSLAGVEAAARAGTKIIGLTTTLTREELTSCDLIADDFRQLTFHHLNRIMSG